MIAVILCILKWILWIILLLIALILFLALLILFVPVRYQLKATKLQDNNNEFTVKAKASWLLNLIRVFFVYPSEDNVKIKVLFFTAYNNNKKKKKAKENKHKSKKHKKNNHNTDSTKTKEAESKTEEDTSLKTIPEAKKQTQEETKKEDRGQTTCTDKTNTKRKTFFDKLKQFLSAIFAFLRNFKYTIKRIYDKIQDIIKNISYYCTLVQTEEFKQALELVNKNLQCFFKHICPRKFKLRVVIGTDDPATTGQILAVNGMLYPLIGDKIYLIPDWEEPHFELDGIIKGRIRLAVLVKIAWKLYFNKNLRETLKRLQKEDINGEQ